MPINEVESKRFVLEGVPRIGFFDDGDRCPEGVPFPSALRACLEYIGEDYGNGDIRQHGQSWKLNYLYTFLMGATGAAFRLSWKTGWHFDNVEIMYMSPDPEAPFRKAFQAVGYDFEIVLNDSTDDNEALLRHKIVQSIRDQRRPVLAFGVIGPPEVGIITGYDEDGDVLLGWNFFQDFPDFNSDIEFEDSGYYRKRNWYEDTGGLILLGCKHEPESLGKVYGESLRWALQVVRTAMPCPDRYNGLAAYGAWADALLCDEDFEADLPSLLEQYMVHNDAVGTVAEGRWYAAQFLRMIAEHEPSLSRRLLEAASLYEEEHDLMWRIWAAVGGNGVTEEHARRLAQPQIRRQIVSIIHEALQKDAQAADNIERISATE